MNRIFSLSFLAIGLGLIVYGFTALDAAGSAFWRFLTRAPTDQTIWLIIAGVLFFTVGAGAVLFGPKPSGKRP